MAASNGPAPHPMDRIGPTVVEVFSPGNTEAEILEKKTLYFDAGAEEVWLCDESGRMSFYRPTGACDTSALFPNFPRRIELR